MTTLLFRTDASARTGGGHAMRSLALAEAHRARGGSSLFVMGEGSEVMASRLASAGVGIETIAAERGSSADADATLAIARTRGARWIVIDGYVFKGDYQRQLRSGHDLVLSVDDWGLARPHHARLVVDQNVAATAADYDAAVPDTELLLGCRYALLRQEFVRGERRAPVTRPRAARFLVTFGASDPARMTAKVVHALSGLEGSDWQAKIVVGPANPDFAAIAAAFGERSEQLELLQGADMSALMEWADLAISAGGSTLWELAYRGVPIVGVAAADNQVANIDRMGALGLATSLGWHETVERDRILETVSRLRDDQASRAAMSAKLQELVDGAGCSRILDRIADVSQR